MSYSIQFLLNYFSSKSPYPSHLLSDGPEFTNPQPSTTMITKEEGDTTTFDCSSTSNPPPHVTWYHDDVKLTTSDVIIVLGSVRLNDGGTYVCVVTSQGGQVNRTFELVVRGEECNVFNDSDFKLIQMKRNLI